MDADLSSLDDLFKEAKQHVRLTKTAKLVAPPPPKAEPGRLYSDPANWNRGKNVALMHRETRNLLGVFAEWHHKTVPGARRLVRDETGLPIHAVEEVEGYWGLGITRPIDYCHRSVEEVEIPQMLLHLADPCVTTFARLMVVFQGAGILAAKTLERLDFGGAGDTVLSLPPGTNIYASLTHECKVALRKEFESCR